jgi:hypothetical protein
VLPERYAGTYRHWKLLERRPRREMREDLADAPLFKPLKRKPGKLYKPMVALDCSPSIDRL